MTFKKQAPTAEVVQALKGAGDQVVSNSNWFVAAGQMPMEPTPDVRQSAFYAGMQCEELAEKLEAVLGDNHPTVVSLKASGEQFKSGNLDLIVEAALRDPKRVEDMLDGDVDLLWVSIGAAQAQGAFIPGAYGEVDRANWGKEFPDGTFHLSPQGKVLKPEGWIKPNLQPYIHPSLRELPMEEGEQE